jgi:hypothetical protein
VAANRRLEVMLPKAVCIWVVVCGALVWGQCVRAGPPPSNAAAEVLATSDVSVSDRTSSETKQGSGQAVNTRSSLPISVPAAAVIGALGLAMLVGRSRARPDDI